MNFAVGDIVCMKKLHPCGSYEWEILRTGMEFRMRCQKCGRLVVMPRPVFERGVKKIIAEGKQETAP